MKFLFASLPARMEAGGIRLRPMRPWVFNFAKCGCHIRYKIEEKDSVGKFRPVGLIGLFNLDFRKSAEAGIEIDEDKRGRGIGETALRLFLNGIREHAFLEEIEARVRPDNGPALHLFRRLGFDEEDSGVIGFRKFRLVFDKSEFAGQGGNHGRTG